MSWKKIKLGELVNIRTGKLNANASSENGKYPFFTCSKEISRIDSYTYECECVLVAGNGVLNAKYYNGKFDAYQRTYIIESKNTKELSVKYLFYFLNKYVEKLRIQAIGGIIKYIKLNYLTDVLISLPPLSEQKRIATILDKADALHQKNKQLLDAYDDLLQTTFLDMFGDPVLNPKGWKVKPLSEVSEVISGVTKGRKLDKSKVITIPYIRVANVQDAHLVLDEIKTIEALPSDLEKYRLYPGDILLTEGGDPDKLGRGAVWRGEVTDCIHQNHIFRVRISDKNITEDYLSALIGSAYGKRYFLKASKQTTGIASINATQLRKFPVIMAPFKVQRKYKIAVENIEAQKAILKQSMQESEDLFNGLVQKAFKGELN